MEQRRAKLSRRGQKRHPSPTAYLGSYARSSPNVSIDTGVSKRTPIPSPRANSSHLQLQHLLEAADPDLKTYGVEELRDGFFDAPFYRPSKWRGPSENLPRESFKYRTHPLSIRRFLPSQFREARSFFVEVITSRAGIKLLKSFLGFFLTYIICLIPASRDWLGRYNYILVISALVNHPGRSIGSQLDGALSTILGTAAGLGWGSLALYLSTLTPTQSGYGGVIAAFLAIFAALIGWFRAIFIRSYQAVLGSGIAIFYICLADTTSEKVDWSKVFDYGIPWVLGQALCLIVSIVVFPDAGSRSLT